MTFTISGLAQLKGSTVIGRDPYALGGFSPKLILDFTSGTYTDGTNTALADITTFSRSGSATMVDSDGLAKWAPHNLHQDFFNPDASGWWRQNGLTYSASAETSPVRPGETMLQLVENVGATAPIVYLQDTETGRLATGETHRWGIIAKTNGRSVRLLDSGSGSGFDGVLNVNLTTGALISSSGAITDYGIEDLGDGKYYVWMEGVATNTSTRAGFQIIDHDGSSIVGDGSSGIYVDHPMLQRVSLGGMAPNPADTVTTGGHFVPVGSGAANYLPRDGHHEYDGVSWNRKMLLETGARTNLSTRFNPTSATWAPTFGATWTNAAGDSPVGTGTAALWTEDTATTAHNQRSELATVASTNRHVWSTLMKSTGRDIWLVSPGASRVTGTISGTQFWNVTIDLSAGTATSTTTHCGMIDYGGGWYRFWMAFVPGSTGVVPIIFGARAVLGGSSVYAGDGTSGVYFDASQCEEGDYPSSFIPTTGATATRAGETLEVNAASLPYSSTGMSTVFKAEVDYVDDSQLLARHLWNWGAIQQKIILILSTFEGKSGNPWMSQQDGSDTGSVRSNYHLVDVYPGGRRTPMKIGSRHTASDVQLVAEGTALGVGTGNLTMPNNSAQPFEFFSTGSIKLNGTIQEFYMWSTDLGASNLETGTT